jgi:hypothetical protein
MAEGIVNCSSGFGNIKRRVSCLDHGMLRRRPEGFRYYAGLAMRSASADIRKTQPACTVQSIGAGRVEASGGRNRGD